MRHGHFITFLLVVHAIYATPHRKTVKIKENTPIGTSVIKLDKNDDGFVENTKNGAEVSKFTVVSQIVRRDGVAGKRVKYFTAQNDGIVYVSQNIDREKVCGSRVLECAIDVKVSKLESDKILE